MNYFVYILRSTKEGSFYIGYTQNLETRLKQHNGGRSRYTSNKGPWEVFYFETYQDKSEAIRREKFLKKQRNVSFYMKLKNKQ